MSLRPVAESLPEVAAPRSVAVNLAPSLSLSELAGLYRKIEQAIPDKKNRLVQFASSYPDEEGSIVAFETAMIGGTSLGKRVLFIDTLGGHPHETLRKLGAAVTLPLDDLLQKGRSINDALLMVARSNLYYGVLRRPNTELAVINLDQIEQLINGLRPSFDLVVIDSAALYGDALGTSLSRLVDGTVLVIGAESTRAPAAMQLRDMVIGNGGTVIGAVLNRRQLHIPRWVYRLMFRGYPGGR